MSGNIKMELCRIIALFLAWHFICSTFTGDPAWLSFAGFACWVVLGEFFR